MGIKRRVIVGIAVLVAVILAGTITGGYLLTGNSRKDFPADGYVLEVVDESRPAYRFAKLKEENQDNLLGRFIEALVDYPKDSVEYMALYEGVEALLETKRG